MSLLYYNYYRCKLISITCNSLIYKIILGCISFLLIVNDFKHVVLFTFISIRLSSKEVNNLERPRIPIKVNQSISLFLSSFQFVCLSFFFFPSLCFLSFLLCSFILFLFSSCLFSFSLFFLQLRPFSSLFVLTLTFLSLSLLSLFFLYLYVCSPANNSFIFFFYLFPISSFLRFFFPW